MTYTVTFILTAEPGTPEHLHMVLKSYLQAKGIELREDGTVDINT
jgi:hypothetical protein